MERDASSRLFAGPSAELFDPVRPRTCIERDLPRFGGLTVATPVKRKARHETVITMLLVIAGIVLAFCLFATGLLWRGKLSRKEALRHRSETPIFHSEDRSKEEKCENRDIANRAFIRSVTL